MKTRLLAIALVWLVGCSLSSGAAQPKLARAYQDWLSGPPSLLITKTEREAFLNLKTDDERDGFIQRFWELRNPAAGTGRNEFQEEFFRRVAYVNTFYGADAGSDGWRTARGRTYILFGKPQSTASFIHNQELYPTELWFYSNPGLTELPPFFYVLFVDKDGIGGYRFYHPYVDGPDKLMRAGPSKQQAYAYLRNINPELARATLTLIPGEPVDTDTYSGSMGSVAIINAAQAYNKMPSYVAMIGARARRLERVTSHVEYDIPHTALLAFVVHQKGQPWVHWQVEVRDPKQPKAAAGRVSFKITARLFVDNRLVFERDDTPGFAAPADGAEALRRRPFVYEDRMPVVPGKYRLAVTVENLAAKQTYEASREFEVPHASESLHLSDVLPVSRYEPDTRERPFAFGGIKFFPDSSGSTSLPKGLRICYSVAVAQPRPAELEVEYVVGGVATKLRKMFTDKLDLRTADQFGTLMTGKTIALDGLPPGAYQVVVRVKDPRTGRIAARSAGFTIAGEAGDVQPVVISQDQPVTPQWLAATHYQRALCWLAQGRSREAVDDLEASWRISQNPAVQGLLQHLQARAGSPAR